MLKGTSKNEYNYVMFSDDSIITKTGGMYMQNKMIYLQ